MKATRFLLPAFMLLLAARPAAAETIRQLSDSYLGALCRTLAAGANEQDVDRVLAYCSEDVVYEHPGLGVKVEGRARMRDGMLSHLSDYVGSGEESGLVVLSRVTSRDAVAVDVRETFWIEREGRREKVERRKLKVIEFKDGHIRRVLDY